MKRSAHANDRLLEICWQTPIGLMEGLVGEDGWLGLAFPLECDQTVPAGHDLNDLFTSPNSLPSVFWSVATWNRGAGFWSPSGTVLKDIDDLTLYLTDFFAGRAPGVRPRIALAPRSPFEAAVWKALANLPFGKSVTYGELALKAGRPGGARAIGQAMHRNPLVLLIPCHRVLAAGSGPARWGGFTGGLSLKRYLLSREGQKIE